MTATLNKAIAGKDTTVVVSVDQGVGSLTITIQMCIRDRNITRADKLTGVKVTGTKQNPAQYLIDGSWYVAGTKADMNSVKSGDTVDAYTINGVVFYAKRTSGENASLRCV